MNLSTADLRNYWTEFHETWWSYRYMFLVDPKLISSNVEFLPSIFYTVFWQPFWKWQTSWKFWKRRIAPLMVTYHCVSHFQNGRHNTAKIQHCPISSKFDMWVDNDVPNWFPTLKNFYQSPFSKWSIQDVEIEQCRICAVLWWPFWKWRPVEIFRCQESIRDIIIYPHIKRRTHQNRS
jgi:hypothetical protein